MFEHIIVGQQHPVNLAAPLDLGFLAEAMLFYGTVEIPFNQAMLKQLIIAAEPEGLDELIDMGCLRLLYRTDFAAIRTDRPRNGIKLHAPVIAQIQRAPELPINLYDIVPNIMIQVLGKERLGRRVAHKLIPKIQTSSIDPIVLDHTKDDFSDADYTLTAALSILRTFVPEYSPPLNPYFRVQKQDDFYVVDTNINMTQAGQLYSRRVPPSHSSMDISYILSHMLNTRLALDYAATKASELAADPVYAELSVHRVNAAVQKRMKSEDLIATFQDFNFDNAYGVREAINSGSRSFTDVIPLVKKAKKFREWLHNKAPETNLIKDYYREVTSSTWVDSLPTKSVRFILFTGTGLLLDAIGAGGFGTLLGIGVSAADQFLLDPILKGWKPNHFVERPLKDFIKGTRK